mmetsp:Transcript_42376/g.67936  ORF Transcript_42376/g.67936 Transcript_42376/m.67936 type:complete len:194 (-) Transcript_42376:2548-3129(-)
MADVCNLVLIVSSGWHPMVEAIPAALPDRTDIIMTRLNSCRPSDILANGRATSWHKKMILQIFIYTMSLIPWQLSGLKENKTPSSSSSSLSLTANERRRAGIWTPFNPSSLLLAIEFVAPVLSLNSEPYSASYRGTKPSGELGTQYERWSISPCGRNGWTLYGRKRNCCETADDMCMFGLWKTEAPTSAGQDA